MEVTTNFEVQSLQSHKTLKARRIQLDKEPFNIQMAAFIESNWNNGRALEPKQELVKFLRDSLPEFRQLSKMTLTRLIKDSELINLTGQNAQYNIPDSQNIGFYLVLKEACNLVFQVQQVATDQEQQHIETQQLHVHLPQLASLNNKSQESFQITNPDSYFEYKEGCQQFTQFPVMLEMKDIPSQVMFVPLKKFNDAIQSFSSSEEKSIKFLQKQLPDLVDKNMVSQLQILGLFSEFCLEKGSVIFKEFQKDTKYSYLVVSGEVLLQIAHNPITSINYKQKHDLDAKNVEDVHNTASGMGNLSLTINKAQAMCLGAGQWIGEEVQYAEMPIIYDAIVRSTSATLWRITNSALINVLGSENQNHIKRKMWTRLKFLRDRVHVLHEQRDKITQMDQATKNVAETYKHVVKILPNSNKVAKQSVRKQLLYKVSGNSDFVLFQDNGMLEQTRRDLHNQSVEATGVGSNFQNPVPFRQKIFQTYVQAVDDKFNVDRVWLERKKSEQEQQPETLNVKPLVRISETLVMATTKRQTLINQLPPYYVPGLKNREGPAFLNEKLDSDISQFSPTLIPLSPLPLHARSRSIVQEDAQKSVLTQVQGSNMSVTHTTVKRLQNRLMNNMQRNLFLPAISSQGQKAVETPKEAKSNSLIALISTCSPYNVAMLESSLKTPSNSGFKAERAFLERLISHKDTQKTLHHAFTMPRKQNADRASYQ